MYPFRGTRPFTALVVSAAAFLAAGAVLMATAGASLPSKIVLHFDSARGVSSFGTPGDLWLMWGVAAAAIVIDAALAALLFRRDRTLSYILAGAAAVLGLFALIAVGTIISIN